ncbi:4-hydroxythreonine-4-phosphate dehydrogenase PdxA [uncultured Pseudodesulfovibrio sp.]|uniref:4-hydroxythreonine-4-phosphate dehydrogenase PdxA n=1 Tax=uncultured Pseudodesulfovibrio sp. TaxID=2035858 RepID=UPI0029C7ADE3|nr:4-hydroxythreonine-4-phosphate dehydrogenase PdxA [uncultured Pseudodesulfovibrio sp.]
MRTLCITLGDPCGLGPELVTRHFLDSGEPTDRFLLIGPIAALDRELARLGAARFFTPMDSRDQITDKSPGVYIYQPPMLKDVCFPPGSPCREGGLSAGVSLDAAIEVLKSGLAQGLLTCPLNKAMLNAAGFDFPGHTEFLAEKLGVGRDNVCMHLCGHDPDDPSPKLRVSLVTTHPRLRDVPALVTRERILHCLRLTADFVSTLGLEGPIGVCGLNPHAGESGRIGDEEIKTVIPALEQAAAEGLNVAGPIPGDTIFHFAAKGQYPAVLAMYHDQGLAPLKLLHFSRAVNVTLGLPYPRTSPDHGTGYDLVGTGEASIDSFRAALDMLQKLVGEAR